MSALMLVVTATFAYLMLKDIIVDHVRNFEIF